jgi:DnaJ-class molecular chaperone
LALWHWQVDAAYKKALKHFHPDHASALDLPQQVQAEETFKLILGMKKTLSLVAPPKFNPFR